MFDFNIKRNDLLPAIEATLKYVDGTAINLTGATVKFIFTKPDGTVINRSATVVSAAAGTVKYEWQTGDTTIAGVMRAEWEITFPGGKLTVPSQGHLSILVTEDLG